MNTTIAVNASSPIPPAASVSLMQDIPLNRIQESKTNPRRTFDEAKLAELAGNIRQHGEGSGSWEAHRLHKTTDTVGLQELSPSSPAFQSLEQCGHSLPGKCSSAAAPSASRYLLARVSFPFAIHTNDLKSPWVSSFQCGEVRGRNKRI